MTITQNVASKLIVAFVATAMLFTFATPAKAATMEELQAQITALMAQIAALTSSASTGAGAAACTFTRPLTVGSQGADVNCLQNYLTSTGHYSFSGGSTGYFGPVTASAVAAWQGANGVAPAAGYFGPVSQAKYSQLMASTPTTPTTPTTPGGGSTSLMGGEGYLDVTIVADSDVTIDFGDSDTVIELEVEAMDSDVQVNRVDFIFDKRPWLYFQEVNLIVDGQEVGSLSRSNDFSEVGSTYRARFSGLNLVIEEGDTANVSLEVVVLNTLPSARVNDVVKVSMTNTSMRFVDGSGVTDNGGIAVTGTDVSFVDVFGDSDVKVTLGVDSPKAATIVLKDSSRTTGVEVLAFDVKAEDGDAEIKEIVVQFSETGNGVGPVVNRARLLADGAVLSTKSVTTASTTVFNELKYMIDKDDSVEFTVEIDFNRGNDLNLPSTFTVASTTVKAENADFQAVTKGLVVNETHNLIVNGIVLKKDTTSTAVVTNTQNADASYGEFRVRYTVQAVGNTMWIPLTSVRGASTTVGAAFQIEDSNGAPVTPAGTTTQSLTRISGGTVNNGFLRINEGQTATLELYVTYNPLNAGQFRVQMLTAGFNPTAEADPTKTQNATPTEDFETGNQNITS